MKHSESLAELATALAKAQGAMEGALKASSNPYFKSRYADLKSVWEACRKALADNQLAVVQALRCEYANGASADVAALAEAVSSKVPAPAVVVTTMLIHSSGQWISEELTMWPKDGTPQPIGSCGSYARRYGLAAMVGVYQADDDAETAQGRTYVEEFPVEVDAPGSMYKSAVKALKDSDATELRRIWNDLNATGDVGIVWKLLSTKQKKEARALLDQTAPQPAAEQPAGDEHEAS